MVSRLDALVGAIPWLVLVICACLSPLAFAWEAYTEWSAILPVAAAVAALYWIVPQALRPVAKRHAWAEGPAALWAVISVGLALRIVWVILVPPVQLSDSLYYLESTRGLLAGDGYYNLQEGHRLLAFRPPGESFLLAAAIAVLGDRSWTPVVVNLVLYAASAWVLHRIVVLVASETRATAAGILYAAWPASIMLTGIATTEVPSMALWLFLLLGLLGIYRTGALWPQSITSGLALGAGILVRPSKMLAPIMLAVLATLTPRPKRALLGTVVLTAIAALLVLPWTYRNYLVLGEIVPVSTNGGDVFYRANNPAASGGYTPRGERDFTYLLPDEVAWDKASRQAGREWVLANPIAFAKLGVRKLLISLSADDSGAVWSMNGGTEIEGWRYGTAVFLSNLWWWLLWALAFASLIGNRSFWLGTTQGRLITSFAAYFFVIHSVFESQTRYHLPAVGPLLVVAAMWPEDAVDRVRSVIRALARVFLKT